MVCALSDAADSAILPQARSSGPASGRCRVALRPEAGQRFNLILEVRDDLQKVDHLQYEQHPTAWTEQCQATTSTLEGNIRFYYRADARAIDLREVCHVQQQIAYAVGQQLLELPTQQLATTRDRRTAPKIEHG